MMLKDENEDKMDTSKKKTYIPFMFLENPIPPRWPKKNPPHTHTLKHKNLIRTFKEKIHFLYTECPANVCDRKKKKTSTQPKTQLLRSSITIQLKSLNAKSLNMQHHSNFLSTSCCVRVTVNS